MVRAPCLFRTGRRLPGMAIEAPDPMVLHPAAGQRRVVYLKPLVRHPSVEVGEYTYYDDPDDPLAFERDAVLYAFRSPTAPEWSEIPFVSMSRARVLIRGPRRGCARARRGRPVRWAR